MARGQGLSVRLATCEGPSYSCPSPQEGLWISRPVERPALVAILIVVVIGTVVFAAAGRAVAVRHVWSGLRIPTRVFR